MLTKLCLFLLQVYLSAIQFGEHVFTMQQDARIATKKLDKERANLQGALEANITLEAKLHISCDAKEP